MGSPQTDYLPLETAMTTQRPAHVVQEAPRSHTFPGEFSLSTSELPIAARRSDPQMTHYRPQKPLHARRLYGAPEEKGARHTRDWKHKNFCSKSSKTTPKRKDRTTRQTKTKKSHNTLRKCD